MISLKNQVAMKTALMFGIITIDYRFPFHFEVWFATISMIVTYGSAVFAVTPKESVRFRYILTAAAGPFLARLLWEAFNRWGGKLLDSIRSTVRGLKSLSGY